MSEGNGSAEWKAPRTSWGSFREPVCAIVYGQSNVGKSTDFMRTFCNAIFIAGPGGLKVGTSVLGFDPGPRTMKVTNIEEAVAAIRSVPSILAKRSEFRFVDAVYIDDATVLATKMMSDLREKYPQQRDFGRLWGEVFEWVGAIGWHTRNIGCHAGMSFHVRPPETVFKKGRGDVFYKGGPMLPSRELTSQIPHIADTVALAEGSPGRLPWPGQYRIEGLASPEWVTKDRHDVLGVVHKTGPMNMRELLNAGGYKMARLPGLEWQEDVAEAICRWLDEGMTPHAAWNRGRDKLAATYPAAAIRWALQDGLARHEYRRIKASALLDCFDVLAAEAAARPPAGDLSGPDSDEEGAAVAGGGLA